MSAPVLTNIEQKGAISGKKDKKKKKTVKNVLGIPDNLNVQFRIVEKHEVAKLQEILNRLLPSARLPLQQNGKSKCNDSKEQSVNDPESKEEAKKRREQLSLGVNAVNKSIKKNLISAVLLANDIQPKFLINHLSLLCDQYKVPYLHMPSFRDTTVASLGFPCIAVGFKTDSCDFTEAIAEIKSVFETHQCVPKNETEEIEASSSESDECDVADEKTSAKRNEIPFTLLYRNSIKERKFVPETDGRNTSKEQTEDNFISVGKDINEINSSENILKLGISSNLIRKQQLKAKRLQDFIVKTNDDKDLQVPKKKRKKDWVIDKVGSKKNYRYHHAKILKIPSNPNRKSGKK